MSVEMLRDLLGWSALVNYLVLLWWFVAFVYAHDLVYRIHTRWFTLTPEQFDAIHYGGIGLYKLLVFVFNLVPFLVLLALT